MQSVDHSTFSKTVTSENFNSAFSRNLVLGKSKKIDFIFPLFDQMFQHTRFSKSINYFFALISYFQFLLSSFWLVSKFWSKISGHDKHVIDVICEIFWFSSSTPDEKFLQMQTIIYTIVFVISCSSIVSELIFYHFNHRFISWTLYPLRFFLEYIPPILIYPLAKFLSSSFLCLYNTKAKIVWLYFIFSIFFFVFFMFITNVYFSLIGRSAYLIKSPFAQIDTTTLKTIYIYAPFIIIGSNILSIFQDWLLLLFIIGHIALLVYGILHALQLPFYDNIVSGGLAAALADCAIADAFQFFGFFINDKDRGVPYLAPVITALVLLVITAPIFIFLAYKKSKTIANELMYPIDVSPLTENAKFDHYESLGLGKDEKKASLYLHISLIESLPNLLDWSLLHFIIQKYQTKNVLLLCLQTLIYFPSETRQLNRLYSQMVLHRDLEIGDRYLAYQIYKIKTLRASSASLDSSEKLSELRGKGISLESDIQLFWKQPTSWLSTYEHLSKSIASLDALWLEAIRDYPNSSKFSEEYARFLIECKTDFESALVQKQRAEMIELGSNFSTDFAFRSLVHIFPQFLKKGFIDIRGNIRRNKRGNGSQSGSNTGEIKNSTADTSSIEIDAELENTLGNLLFRDHKVRLALHRSLKNRKTRANGFFFTLLILCTLLGFIEFLGVFLLLRSDFNKRKRSVYELKYATDLHFYLGLSSYSTLLYFAQLSGSCSGLNDYLSQYRADDNAAYSSLNTYIDTTKGLSYDQYAVHYQNDTRTALTNLVEIISNISKNNAAEILKLVPQLMNNSLYQTTCYTNTDGSISILIPYPSNLEELVVTNLYQAIKLLKALDGSKYITFYTEFCEISNNWIKLEEVTNQILASFMIQHVEDGDEIQKTIKLLTFVCPLSIILVYWIPAAIAVLVAMTELTQYGKALLQFDSNIKQEAMKPLRKYQIDQEEVPETTDPKKYSNNFIPLLIGWIVITLLLAAFIFLMLIFSKHQNDDISKLSSWEYLACLRVTMPIKIINDVTLVLLIGGDSSLETFTTSDALTSIISKKLLELKQANEYLQQGVTELVTNGSSSTEKTTISPCLAYDDKLDSLLISASCEVQGNDPMHNSYMCSNSNQMISIFFDFAKEIIETPAKFGGRLESDAPAHMFHLGTSHLTDATYKCLERIVELSETKASNAVGQLHAFLLMGIILTMITSAYIRIINKICTKNLQSCFIFLKHSPPLSIVNSKRLMQLLLNRRSSHKDNFNSVEQMVVKNSHDGILCTGQNGVIEVCNPAVTQLFGFTPEQLLGQPITTIFDEAEALEIEKQMDLMRTGQSTDFYQGHTKCITDHETSVPVQVTILALTGTRSTVIESFGIFLRDETLIIQHQQEAEQAKMQSEKLLFQILPRDIVFKLNRGEKDISFVAPSATIIFIDIVRFSDYASTLTPEGIMSNLSVIFGEFDTLIAKYPLIYKIKLIGDVYMAAAGLFSPDVPPAQHAEQTIRFGLDAITELDDLNVKLNSNLSVRVGVNTGGPIICGVLGTDKPVFDIIGDAINVASRLQSTDVPGRIQIPQSVHELIAEMNFEIEDRGEVFLKGKGKTFSYFVRPTNSFIAQFSSAQDIDKSPLLVSMDRLNTVSSLLAVKEEKEN